MANTKLQEPLSLMNHYRVLEHSIFGSKVIVELLRHVPLASYPTTKLEDCLLILESLLDEAILRVRNCNALWEYCKLHSDSD